MSDLHQQGIEAAAKAIYESPAYGNNGRFRIKVPWAETSHGHLEFDRDQDRIRAEAAIDAYLSALDESETLGGINQERAWLVTRIRELEAEVERLRARTHEIQEGWDKKCGKLRAEAARRQRYFDEAREKVSHWTSDWHTTDNGPGSWWRSTSSNHATEVTALIARATDAEAELAELRAAAREAIEAFDAGRFSSNLTLAFHRPSGAMKRLRALLPKEEQ